MLKKRLSFFAPRGCLEYREVNETRFIDKFGHFFCEVLDQLINRRKVRRAMPSVRGIRNVFRPTASVLKLFLRRGVFRHIGRSLDGTTFFGKLGHFVSNPEPIGEIGGSFA